MVRERSAKPLCVGSIPTRASNTFSNLESIPDRSKKPLINIGVAARALNLSIPTVSAALKRLEELAIAKETTGKERDRIFAYTRYLEIVSAGTEPIQA